MIEDRQSREKLDEVLERLTRIEEGQKSFSDKINEHHRSLYGINGEPGLTIKMDRIEQLEDSRKVHRGLIYTALGGLTFERLWHLFLSKVNG